jgi:diguanylate cyclase (GGDEF)-like protein/PAS domain S-box-containing protein
VPARLAASLSPASIVVPSARRPAPPSAAVLRRRMALVLAVALVPLVLLAVLGAGTARRDALAWAEAEIGDTARQAAAWEGERLSQAVYALRAMDGPAEAACATAAARLAPGGPVAAIAVRWADGREACRANIAPPAARPAPGHLAAALAAAGSVVLAADAQAGLVAMRALPGVPGAVAEMVLAPPVLAGPPMWRGHLRAMLVDPDDATVLAVAPAASGLVGGHMHAPRLLAAIRNMPGGGTIVARNGQGVEQVAGFAPVPGIEGLAGRAVMVASLPQAVLLEEADSRLIGQVAIALVVAVAAAAASWHLAERVLVRPLGTRPAREAVLAPTGAAWLRHQADLAMAVDFSGEMVLRLDDELRVTFASPGTRGVLGYAPTEVLGASLAGEPDWDACRAVLLSLRDGGGDLSCRFATRRKDDSEVWLEVRAGRLADGGFVLACRDIGAERALARQLAEARERLAELAREDVQTGLANRRRFDEALEQEVRRARRVQEPLALVLLRLAMPPADGAAVLEGVAGVLSAALRRPGDLAARFDADVFALLLPTTDRIGAERMAERLREALAGAGMPAAAVPVGIGATSVLPLDEAVGAGEVLAEAQAALAGAPVATPVAVPGRPGVTVSRAEQAA